VYHKTIISLFPSVHRQTGTGMFSVGDKKLSTVAASALVGSLLHACGVAIHRRVRCVHVYVHYVQCEFKKFTPRFSGNISPTTANF